MTSRTFYIFTVAATIFTFSCKAPQLSLADVDKTLPANIDTFNIIQTDTSGSLINWRDFFDDDYLSDYIDSALVNNQELKIITQEIEMSRNEILEKSGEYLPFVDFGIATEVEKTARYTRNGAVEHELEIKEDREFPEPFSDIFIGATASWEVDIWKKMRNAQSAAEFRFLAENEGRSFLVTQLVSEIAESYYELIALDNLLAVIDKNLKLQTEAFHKAEQLKNNAKATQLAVNRFKAQLINTKNKRYAIYQKRIETENKINFIIGRYPQEVKRNPASLLNIDLDSIRSGIASELLLNRPDVRKAEYLVEAKKMDVESARANFFPRLDIKAALGFQSFEPKFIFNPESIAFNLAGDIVAPLVNKKAIKAIYNMASASQIASVYEYQQTVLNAYVDVLNQMNKLDNSTKAVNTKLNEVDILNKSVDVANSLFKYAKADYVEVLLTQEEALDAQMELIEAKLKQIHSKIQIYRSLGGGWL